jgi:hypothetical protein
VERGSNSTGEEEEVRLTLAHGLSEGIIINLDVMNV